VYGDVDWIKVALNEDLFGDVDRKVSNNRVS